MIKKIILIGILFLMILLVFGCEELEKKYCEKDGDCQCCDGLDGTNEKNVCVNKEYIQKNKNCLQIEMKGAFCAKNYCKCADNKCEVVVSSLTSNEKYCVQDSDCKFHHGGFGILTTEFFQNLNHRTYENVRFPVQI